MTSPSHDDETPSHRASGDAPITYPENQVIGVLDDAERVATAVEALTAGGFGDDDVHVSCGAERADALRDTTGRRGLAGLATRIADTLGIQNVEMEMKAHYEQAMRDGRYVVRVEAPSDDRKARAAGILQEHGGHAISYHGRYTIEGMVPPNRAS